MKGKAKRVYRVLGAGHPLHAMVVHFPMACFVLGWGSQVGAFLCPNWVSPDPSSMLLATGLVFLIPAILTGAMELWVLEFNDRQAATVVWHLITMGTAGTLFFLGWLVGFLDRGTVALTLGINTLGLASLVAGAWFGGELVYNQGVATSGEEQTHRF